MAAELLFIQGRALDYCRSAAYYHNDPRPTTAKTAFIFEAPLESHAKVVLVISLAVLFALLDWWDLLLGATFALGWAVRVFGWAPYTIGIYFAAWISDVLVIIVGWFVRFGDYCERYQDPNHYFDPPVDEWAFYYEYHDWLIGSGRPIPPVLQRRINYINDEQLGQ